MTPLSSVLLSLLSLSQLAMAEEMSQPEQELLAKYLLQQLTSDTPDPILARLVREEEAGEILAGQQSQTIATIVPAPPGLSTAGSKQHETYVEDKQRSAQRRSAASRFSMPLTALGDKSYYLGIFFKANWARSAQYCRYHGLHLASLTSDTEQRLLEKHIETIGLGQEHFWTSGTDQGEEGQFVWMSTGKPLGFENWNAGEPNNYEYEGGEREHCLELWNRDGKGLKWNDSPCSFETYFICEL